MNREIITIDVGDMHYIRAKKIIRYMSEHGNYKDFPEPTVFEKMKYYSGQLVIILTITIALNINTILPLIK